MVQAGCFGADCGEGPPGDWSGFELGSFSTFTDLLKLCHAIRWRFEYISQKTLSWLNEIVSANIVDQKRLSLLFLPACPTIISISHFFSESRIQVVTLFLLYSLIYNLHRVNFQLF